MNEIQLTNAITKCAACELSALCNVGPITAYIHGAIPLDILFINFVPMKKDNDNSCSPISDLEKRFLINVMNSLNINNWGITAGVKCQAKTIKAKHKDACIEHLLNEIKVYNPKHIIGLGINAGESRYRTKITSCSYNTYTNLNWIIASGNNENNFIQFITHVINGAFEYND